MFSDVKTVRVYFMVRKKKDFAIFRDIDPYVVGDITYEDDGFTFLTIDKYTEMIYDIVNRYHGNVRIV